MKYSCFLPRGRCMSLSPPQPFRPDSNWQPIFKNTFDWKPASRHAVCEWAWVRLTKKAYRYRDRQQPVKEPRSAHARGRDWNAVKHRDGKNVCKRRSANAYVRNTCIRRKLQTAFAKRLHLQTFCNRSNLQTFCKRQHFSSQYSSGTWIWWTFVRLVIIGSWRSPLKRNQ